MLFRISPHLKWKSISSVAEAIDAVKSTVGVYVGDCIKHQKGANSKKRGFGINLFALSERSVKKYSSIGYKDFWVKA